MGSCSIIKELHEGKKVLGSNPTGWSAEFRNPIMPQNSQWLLEKTKNRRSLLLVLELKN